MPLRPNIVRSTASASRTSPSIAGAMNTISAPAATALAPWLLHAQANAVSARLNTSPPWAIA